MDKELRRVLAKKYNGMKQRCYNQKNSEYRNYGGRCIYSGTSVALKTAWKTNAYLEAIDAWNRRVNDD